MSHRIRTIIPHLDYAELTKLKILPAEKMFTAKTVQSIGGEYPSNKLAKSLGPSEYGLFLEQIIEALLDNNCDIKCLTAVGLQLSAEDREHFAIDHWIDIACWLEKEFVIKGIFVEPQVELEDAGNKLIGHPDLVSTDTIYDIKTTGRFGKMRVETIFQLLSYYCLAQQKGLPVKNIGLVLPLQKIVKTYNLSLWNWKPFYSKLVDCVNKKITKETTLGSMSMNISSQIVFVNLFHQFVGSHCHKDGLLDAILFGKPLQFFVNGNTTARASYKPKFLMDLTKANETSTAPIFIHSPYVLNLCHPGNKNGERQEDEYINKELGMSAWGGWTFYCLKNLLEFGSASGAKGVVVHVGKSLKHDYAESLENMWYSVIACSQWATPECPLLIETPAGQGTEVLCSPEELGDFYLSLPQPTKDVVGICVDSCHVFSAGRDPNDYLSVLEKMGVPINLIHYNDSKGECGCKKDRHAMIGKGYIGMDSLMQTLQYCIKQNIPLLTE